MGCGGSRAVTPVIAESDGQQHGKSVSSYFEGTGSRIHSSSTVVLEPGPWNDNSNNSNKDKTVSDIEPDAGVTVLTSTHEDDSTVAGDISGLENKENQADTQVQSQVEDQEEKLTESQNPTATIIAVSDSDQENVAATKIQAQYRGYAARKGMKKVEPQNQSTPAAITTEVGNTDNENQAATKIQAQYRGYITRKDIKKLPPMRLPSKTPRNSHVNPSDVKQMRTGSIVSSDSVFERDEDPAQFSSQVAEKIAHVQIEDGKAAISSDTSDKPNQQSEQSAATSDQKDTSEDSSETDKVMRLSSENDAKMSPDIAVQVTCDQSTDCTKEEMVMQQADGSQMLEPPTSSVDIRGEEKQVMESYCKSQQAEEGASDVISKMEQIEVSSEGTEGKIEQKTSNHE